MSDDLPKMVGWYSPRLLLKAAVEVVVSTLFGQHADQRTVQALTGSPQVSDYSTGKRVDQPIQPRLLPYEKVQLTPDEPAKEMWFDYTADLGDGWDSTYSVAWLMTRDKLDLVAPGEDKPRTLKPGSIVIFGGDQVYPTASREEYDRRFIAPYESALNDGQEREHTDVYAIPGNHDWYDSLRSFSRIFFSDVPFVRAPKAPTETPQTRSYFAIRLPSNWWLLGTDVQLGSDIDANQLEYFRTVAKTFGPDDKVILCTAEPHWTTAKKAEKRESVTAPSALDRLEQEVLGQRVRAFVAGDVHHYMRFELDEENKPPVHKITAGGGGAFLHPTHRTWKREITEPVSQPGKTPRKFTRPDNAVYPTERKSLQLSLRNWLFALLNPRFGILTAVLYVVFALMMMPAFMRYEVNIEKQKQRELTKRERMLQQNFFEEVRNFMALAETDSGNPSTVPGRIRDIAASVFQANLDSKAFIERVRQQYPLETGDLAALSQQARNKFEIVQSLGKQLEEVRSSQHEVTKAGYAQKMSRSFERMGWLRPREAPPTDGDGSSQTRVESKTADPITTAPDSAAVESNRRTARRSSKFDDAIPGSSDDSQSFPGQAVSYFLELSKQEAALPDPFQSMLGILVFVAAISAFIAFTDIPNMFGRVVLGTLHGCTHWVAAYLITLLASPMIVRATGSTYLIVGVIGLVIAVAWGRTSDTPGQSLLRRSMPPLAAFLALTLALIGLTSHDSLINSSVVIVVFVAGWVTGSFIMGGYLFLAHTIFGQHWNESFSSIRCKDWKCFLRFHLAEDGELTIYPIGIPRVCRDWQVEGQHVRPAGDEVLKPVLIEKPIVLR